MSKFTKAQKSKLKSLVANAMIRRLDIHETRKYIQDAMHITISLDYIYHVKMWLRKDANEELDTLARDRSFFLKKVFFDRIEELQYQQKVLHDIIDKNRDKQDKHDIVIRAVHELRPLTAELRNAYQTLPATAALEVPSSYYLTTRVEQEDFDENNPPVF